MREVEGSETKSGKWAASNCNEKTSCSTSTRARCIATHASRSARAEVHWRARRKPRERARATNAPAGGTGGHTHTTQHCTTRVPCGEGGIPKTSRPPRLYKKRCLAKSKEARTQASNSHKLATTTKNRARACQSNTHRFKQTRKRQPQKQPDPR